MLTYRLKCKKNILENNVIIKLYVAVKKSSVVKEQQAKGLLRSLGLQTTLNEISLLYDILFQFILRIK